MLSDVTARHIVAKLSAILDLAAIILTSAGVLASHGKYHLFCAAGIFWGLSTACDSNTDALFADSVTTAERSAQFTQLQALSLACLGGGPLIAAAIFHQQGTLPSNNTNKHRKATLQLLTLPVWHLRGGSVRCCTGVEGQHGVDSCCTQHSTPSRTPPTTPRALCGGRDCARYVGERLECNVAVLNAGVWKCAVIH